MLIFLVIPIGVVVVWSFNTANFLVFWEGWGLRWWRESFDNTRLIESVQNSFTVATLSTVLAVTIGGVGGIALARRPGRWAVPFVAVLFLVLVTPEIVDAISYLLWFTRIGVDSGLARLAISHSVFSSAVVAFVVRARLAGLDPALENAAADLGATPFRTLRTVIVPLAAPALFAGALLAFTMSLDNVIVSSFVKTTDTITFPVYALGTLRTGGPKGDLAVAGTVFLIITIVSLFTAAIVLRRGGRSSQEVVTALATS
jgi:ABC-type spermidine/putrescine transport system permease subunit II